MNCPLEKCGQELNVKEYREGNAYWCNNDSVQIWIPMGECVKRGLRQHGDHKKSISMSYEDYEDNTTEIETAAEDESSEDYQEQEDVYEEEQA